MPKQNTETTKKLPRFAPWLIGWGALCIVCTGIIYLWRVIFYLGEIPALPFTLGAIGICSLVYIAVFVVFHFFKEKSLNARAAILVFLFGLLFCFATAPLQVPDESAHYLRMNSLSYGNFTYNYGEACPNDVSLLIEAFPRHMNHQITYGGHQIATHTLSQYLADVQNGVQPVSPATASEMFVSIPYMPGAAFMAVGRLFGLGALGQMYAGRIANLLIYAILCYFTFKNTPRFKSVMYCFAFLPLSLFMAASCSYDSLMLGLIWLVISFAFKEKLDAKTFVIFSILLAFSTYVKPINILLVVVLLLIPKENWHFRLNKWLSVLILAAAAGALYFLAGYINGNLLKVGIWPVFARGSGITANPAVQLTYILQNPLRFIVVIINTLFEENGFIFNFGTFGGMDLLLPVVSGLSVVCIGFATVQSGIYSPLQPGVKRNRIAIGLMAVAVIYKAGVIVGMYVQVNDLYSIRVTDLQPRYFLPASILLALACSQFISGRVRPRQSGNAQQAALRAEKTVLYVCMGLAALTAVLLFQSYWVGQWLPKAEGGYKLVNMLSSR